MQLLSTRNNSYVDLHGVALAKMLATRHCKCYSAQVCDDDVYVSCVLVDTSVCAPKTGLPAARPGHSDVFLPALSAPNFPKCNLGWSILGHLEGWKAGRRREGLDGKPLTGGHLEWTFPNCMCSHSKIPASNDFSPAAAAATLSFCLLLLYIHYLGTVLYSINSWLTAQVAWKIIRPTSKVPAIRFFAPHLQQTSYSDYYSRRLDLKCLKLTGCLLA